MASAVVLGIEDNGGRRSSRESMFSESTTATFEEGNDVDVADVVVLVTGAALGGGSEGPCLLALFWLLSARFVR